METDVEPSSNDENETNKPSKSRPGGRGQIRKQKNEIRTKERAALARPEDGGRVLPDEPAKEELGSTAEPAVDPPIGLESLIDLAIENLEGP